MSNLDENPGTAPKNPTGKIPFTPDLIEKILVAFEGQEIFTRSIDLRTKDGDKRTLCYEKSSRTLFLETPNGRVLLDPNDAGTYANLVLPATAVEYIELLQNDDERVRIIAEQTRSRSGFSLGIG